MTKREKKGQGGKLNRSEIIQTRLDPRLRYAAELIARKQRRTLSSLIECLIETACKNETLEVNLSTSKILVDPKPMTVMHSLKYLWDPDEAVRFVALALAIPELLTHEEEALWTMIESKSYFWMHYALPIEDDKTDKISDIHWYPVNTIDNLIRKNLCEYWDRINSNTFSPDDIPNEIGGKVERPEDIPYLRWSIQKFPHSEQFDWRRSHAEITPNKKGTKIK